MEKKPYEEVKCKGTMNQSVPVWIMLAYSEFQMFYTNEVLLLLKAKSVLHVVFIIKLFKDNFICFEQITNYMVKLFWSSFMESMLGRNRLLEPKK